MPALNFKKQFVPKILSLAKLSTIRGKRKNPINRNDTLILYSGMRTKQCVKIGTAICSSTSRVRVCEDAPYILMHLTSDNGKPKWYRFDKDALKHLCNIDGFANYKEMRDFFKNQYGLPFEGDLIEWRDFKASY